MTPTEPTPEEQERIAEEGEPDAGEQTEVDNAEEAEGVRSDEGVGDEQGAGSEDS
jgi:hypothetical protein